MRIKDVEIQFLGHAGFFFKIINGVERKIAIDPYNISEKASEEKADIILITHSHYDHCSIKDIEKLVKPGTVVVATPDCQSKVLNVEGIKLEVIEVGDKIDLGGIGIKAVSSYNIDKDFHPKSEGWVGYLVKIKDVIVYHSGDSDFIPEMNKLSGYGKHGNEFVALLPVSGKFVMDAEEASEAASIISPDLCIPMHYGAGVAGTEDDAKRFVEFCKEKNLKAEMLEKI
jgi:L-ascorbate metabolism protein UlaG (beta-lactamase superfamily)